MPRWTEELGAFALDREGNVTLASPLAEQISGHDLTALLQHHFLKYIAPDDEAESRAIFAQALSGQKVAGTRQIVVADGSQLTVGYTLQPDRRNDEIVGVTGTVWIEKGS